MYVSCLADLSYELIEAPVHGELALMLLYIVLQQLGMQDRTGLHWTYLNQSRSESIGPKIPRLHNKEITHTHTKHRAPAD